MARLVADRIRAPWCIDFIGEELASGRRFRTLGVVDELMRDCFALESPSACAPELLQHQKPRKRESFSPNRG